MQALREASSQQTQGWQVQLPSLPSSVFSNLSLGLPTNVVPESFLPLS